MNRSSLGRQKGKAFQAEVTGSRPRNPSTYGLHSPGRSSSSSSKLTVLSPSPASPPPPTPPLILVTPLRTHPFLSHDGCVQTEPNLFQGGLTGVEQSAITFLFLEAPPLGPACLRFFWHPHPLADSRWAYKASGQLSHLSHVLLLNHIVFSFVLLLLFCFYKFSWVF